MKIDIKSFLDRTGMTQKELADAVGLSESMISTLKKGGTDTSATACKNFLLAGMTLGELFGPEVERAVKSTLEEKKGPCAPFPDEICRMIVSRGMDALKKEGIVH